MWHLLSRLERIRYQLYQHTISHLPPIESTRDHPLFKTHLLQKILTSMCIIYVLYTHNIRMRIKMWYL